MEEKSGLSEKSGIVCTKGQDETIVRHLVRHLVRRKIRQKQLLFCSRNKYVKIGKSDFNEVILEIKKRMHKCMRKHISTIHRNFTGSSVGYPISGSSSVNSDESK